MTAVLVVLAGIGVLSAALSVSLVPRRGAAAVLVIVTGLVCVAVHERVAAVHLDDLLAWLRDPRTATLGSLLLLGEGLGTIVAWHTYTERRHPLGAAARPLWPGQRRLAAARRIATSALRLAAFLPSALFVLAALVLLSWLYHVVSGVSFEAIAAAHGAGTAAVLAAATLLLAALLPGWRSRVELRVMLALFQAGVAMLLPVLAIGGRSIDALFPVDLVTTASVLTAVVAVAAVGFLLQRAELRRLQQRV